jgi:hypothetical protein
MEHINTFLDSYNKDTIKKHFDSTFKSAGVDFDGIIMDAHALTLAEASVKPKHHISKNWMAETMYGHMIGIALERHRDMVLYDQENRPYIKLGNDIRMYFKKLDEKYRPSNIDTEHVKNLLFQKIEEEGTQIYIGYVGYIINDGDWTQVVGTYTSYIHKYYRKRIEWVLQMTDYIEYAKSAALNKQTVIDEEEIKLVKPKTDEQKTKEKNGNESPDK